MSQPTHDATAGTLTAPSARQGREFKSFIGQLAARVNAINTKLNKLRDQESLTNNPSTAGLPMLEKMPRGRGPTKAYLIALAAKISAIEALQEPPKAEPFEPRLANIDTRLDALERKAKEEHDSRLKLSQKLRTILRDDPATIRAARKKLIRTIRTKPKNATVQQNRKSNQQLPKTQPADD